MLGVSRYVNKALRKPAVRAIGIPAYRAMVRSVFWQPPPKVLAISMPKAGTHLVGRVLGLLPSMLYSGLHVSEEHLNSSREMKLSNSNLDQDYLTSVLRSCRNGQYLTAHLPYIDSVPDLLEGLKVKPIIVLRDPRDVAVSYVHYVSNEPRHFHYRYYNEVLNSFDQRLEATINGFKPERQLMSHGLRSLKEQIEDYMPWLNTETTIVRFEDLIGPNGGGSISLQKEQVRRIAEVANRKLNCRHLDLITRKAFSINARTFRSGKLGAWSRVSSDKNLDLFADIDKTIVAFGYKDTISSLQ